MRSQTKPSVYTGLGNTTDLQNLHLRLEVGGKKQRYLLCPQPCWSGNLKQITHMSVLRD